MKMVIDWKTGEPEKDGKYYALTPRYMRGGKYYAGIDVLSFTVRYGWNTSRAYDGEYILYDGYTVEENAETWSNITHWAELEMIEGEEE